MFLDIFMFYYVLYVTSLSIAVLECFFSVTSKNRYLLDRTYMWHEYEVSTRTTSNSVFKGPDSTSDISSFTPCGPVLAMYRLRLGGKIEEWQINSSARVTVQGVTAKSRTRIFFLLGLELVFFLLFDDPRGRK